MSAPADKPRLTAEQKKANHIESERKRREAIRGGFENLADIVPESKGQARSEGVVLANTVKHIHDLNSNKEDLRKQSRKKGMSELRFEQHYRDVTKKMQDERNSKDDAASASSPSGGKGTGSSKPSKA